jgi:hypothetical protein
MNKYFSIKPSDLSLIEEQVVDSNNVILYKIKVSDDFVTENITIDKSSNRLELHIKPENIDASVLCSLECSLDKTNYYPMLNNLGSPVILTFLTTDTGTYIREINGVGGFRRLSFGVGSATTGTFQITATQGD